MNRSGRPTPASTASLKDARALYHKKKYAQVIALLEKDIFNFYEDADYFLVLGCSYFKTGDMGGAEAFFQRILKIDPKHTEANLGLSLIASLRGDSPKAVRYALSLLDGKPDEVRGTELLNGLRRHKEKNALQIWTRSAIRGKLAPQVPGKPFPWKPFVGLFALISAFMAAWIFLPPLVAEITAGPKPENIREGVEERGIEGMPEFIRFSGEFEEIFRPDEVQKIFRDAQDLLQEYNDNEARVLINRLLRSNASDSVRAQALSLVELLSRPDMTAEFTSYDLKTIQSRPVWYEGVFVRWKGSVANMLTTETEITFDFLVGYHEGKILEGVVPARIGFAVRLGNGDPVDVLAQVVLDQEKGWYLDVVGIHVMGVRRSP